MNNIYDQIAERLSEEALLEQLIEECGELIQASAKRLRIIRGENFTPLGKEANFENVIEELADVTVCMNAYSWKADIDADHFGKLRESKKGRWLSRLEGGIRNV